MRSCGSNRRIPPRGRCCKEELETIESGQALLLFRAEGPCEALGKPRSGGGIVDFWCFGGDTGIPTVVPKGTGVIKISMRMIRDDLVICRTRG